MEFLERNIRKRRHSISVFRGINRSVNTAMSRISSSNSNLYMEFKDTKNMCLDDYPVIRTRDKRRFLSGQGTVISNILAGDSGIIRIVKDNVGAQLYNGTATVMLTDRLTGEVYSFDKNIEHRLVEFGNRVVVLPDNVIIENGHIIKMENFYTSASSVATEQLTEYTLQKMALNTSVEVSGNRFAEDLSKMAADVFQPELQNNATSGSQSYMSFFNQFSSGDILEDTSTTPTSLYLVTEINTSSDYSGYFNNRLVTFTQINNTYTKIYREGIGKGFAVDDWVRVECGDINSSHKIVEVGDDYIILNCEIDKSEDYTGEVTIKRQLPCDMDFMVCVDNRLWGCSSKNNGIYASRLGDATNWEAYGDGIASDSYWVDISSEGDFTGIVGGNSAVYFFKENCVHRIYGSKPRNYTLTTYLDMGVKKGFENTLLWLKDRLFYYSPSGVVMYSPGGEPTVISEDAFGAEKYISGSAGKHKGKYVICLEKESGEYDLMVYDTESGQWLKEDDECFDYTASYRDVMYFHSLKTGYIGCMNADEDSLIHLESGSSELLEENDLEFMLLSGDLYDSYAEKKYIQKVELTFELESGEVSLWVSTNFSAFEKVRTRYATDKKSFAVALHPKRCDHFRILLKGRGMLRLYGITITTEEGSQSNGRL